MDKIHPLSTLMVMRSIDINVNPILLSLSCTAMLEKMDPHDFLQHSFLFLPFLCYPFKSCKRFSTISLTCGPLMLVDWVLERKLEPQSFLFILALVVLVESTNTSEASSPRHRSFSLS